MEPEKANWIELPPKQTPIGPTLLALTAKWPARRSLLVLSIRILLLPTQFLTASRLRARWSDDDWYDSYQPWGLWDAELERAAGMIQPGGWRDNAEKSNRGVGGRGGRAGPEVRTGLLFLVLSYLERNVASEPIVSSNDSSSLKSYFCGWQSLPTQVELDRAHLGHGRAATREGREAARRFGTGQGPLQGDARSPPRHIIPGIIPHSLPLRFGTKSCLVAQRMTKPTPPHVSQLSRIDTKKSGRAPAAARDSGYRLHTRSNSSASVWWYEYGGRMPVEVWDKKIMHENIWAWDVDTWASSNRTL